MKLSAAFRNAAIVLTVLYAAITLYRLSLNSDLLFCVFNPVECAAQSVILQALSTVEIVVNPLTIMVLAALYFVTKEKEKRARA